MRHPLEQGDRLTVDGDRLTVDGDGLAVVVQVAVIVVDIDPGEVADVLVGQALLVDELVVDDFVVVGEVDVGRPCSNQTLIGGDDGLVRLDDGVVAGVDEPDGKVLDGLDILVGDGLVVECLADGVELSVDEPGYSRGRPRRRNRDSR